MITKLRLQAKNQNRVSVFLEGEYAFGLSKILAVGLREGQELSDERIADLKAKERQERAFQRAINLLGRRPRSELELRRYFERNGFTPEVQEAVLDRLRVAGLVDDLAFAGAWVENRSAFRPRGAIGLRAELRKKGIAPETIDAALEGLDERSAAGKAAEKASRRWKHLSEDDYRRRLEGYLARRGFPFAMITEVVTREWHRITSETEESEVDE